MALLLANTSMSTTTGGEGEIRRALVNSDLIECMLALPGQLFTNTVIPACVWFLTKNKRARGDYRNRIGELLVIDAGDMGQIKDRVSRELSETELDKISSAFKNWRRGKNYRDEAGFCKSLTVEEVAKKSYSLIPGLYVGMPSAN